MHRLFFAMFLGSVFAVETQANDGTPGSRKWDFESDSAGNGAAGFRSSVGTWSVALDGQNRVLAQTAKNTDAVFNVIVRPDVQFSDVDLSVRLKANLGNVDQGAASSGV
jgi:hypothetical protein